MNDHISPMVALFKCQGCGAEFEAVPGSMDYRLCLKCERRALKMQLEEAHDHLISIRDKLQTIHQHPEWTCEKVRMEIYSLILYNF